MSFVKTTNKYYFCDYEQPIVPIKNDMRTTYTRGHNNYLLNDTIAPPQVSGERTCQVLANKEASYNYTSETQNQFTWKQSVTDAQNASMAGSCRRRHFIQFQQERTFRRPPKPIKPTHTYSEAYTKRPAVVGEPFIPVASVYRAPPKSTDTIYCNRMGHYKYMDPYATTNMMAHPPHTVDQQNGIGRKDHITLWDWIEMPKCLGYGLQFYPVKQKENVEPLGDRAKFALLVKDRLIPNTWDLVPHNGMRSEQRAEYGIPVETKFTPNVYGAQPLQIPPTGITTGSTEYTMYGSGRKIDSFLKQT